MALSKTARNTLILLLVFGLPVLIVGSVSEREARLLWAIHDPGPAPDGGGESLRFARDSLIRAHERGGPGALVFDAWALLAGPSVEAARMLSRLAALLVVALVLVRRWRVAVLMAVPFVLFTVQAGLPRLYFGAPDWDSAARYIADQRDPREPLLFAFRPDEPLGYYDRRYGLRQGITLDLGWRTHEPAEITAYIERLAGADTIWLVLPVDEAVMADVHNALAPDYAPVEQTTIDGLHIARYDRHEP